MVFYRECMPGADYSHYREQFYRPETVARLQARGEEPSDRVLLEILSRLDPPLLGEKEIAAVRGILRRRPGRPPSRGVPSRPWLARQILAVDRADVDGAFLKALADRVLNPDGPTEYKQAVAAIRGREKRDRNMFINGIYWEIYDALERKPRVIFYEPIGELIVPRGIGTRGDIAAEMVHDIVSNRLKMRAPAISTIRKIARMR
jgi:hypothetical protein